MDGGMHLVVQCLVLDPANFITVPVAVTRTSAVQDLQVTLNELLYVDDADIRPSMFNLHLAVDDSGNCLFSSAPEISWFKRGVKAPLSRWLRKKMDPTSVIGDVIPSVALPYQIHVLVEPPEDFYVGRDDVYDQFTKPYHATAAFSKDSSEVNQLVDLIKQKKVTDASVAPFIVLENSIGMGKTQMAFNLMAHSDVDVFYITLTEDVTNLLVAFLGGQMGLWSA